MITIGIDPDSKAHGVAIYYNGKLSELKSMPFMELYDTLNRFKIAELEMVMHIENVCGSNAVFMPRGSSKQGESKARHRTLGMCQQAQLEVERMAEHLGVKIVRHKISSNWKSPKHKAIFEAATKWKGRSNEDNRSAAYFGFIGLQS